MKITSDELRYALSHDMDLGTQTAEYALKQSVSDSIDQRQDINYGWVCPKCGRVMAPFVPYCPCNGNGIATTASTNQG